MRKILLSVVALAAMLIAPQSAQAQSGASLVYNFAGLKAENNLQFLNGGDYYVYYSESQPDMLRYNFRGYQNYEGEALSKECHVWRYGDSLDGYLSPEGLLCPKDREMVVDGLGRGSVVKINYDNSAVEGEGDAKMVVYITGASAKTQVEIDGAAPVAGQTTIASGAEIKVLDGQYIAFKVKKGMVIQSVEVSNVVYNYEAGTTVKSDFAAEDKVYRQPAKQNGSVSNGQVFYIWEKPEKTHSLRQDYRGYKWEEGLKLPEVCHVWRRGDNINNNIGAGGLLCPNDKEMVIDGLEPGSEVTITFDATNASTKELLWVPGVEVALEATIDGKKPVIGETTIPSGKAINVVSTADGYIAVKVFKNMVISKIEVKNAAETLTYNFTLLKSRLETKNYSSYFYVWEKADKADSRRQDFKGYQNYAGANLPATCQVWHRSDRYDQDNSLINGGLNCPNNREMVINELKAGDMVKINYDATNASTKEMLWATGASAGTEATVNGVAAVSGATAIPSGAEIKIVSTEGGYFGFKVFKGMVITSVEVVNPSVEAENVVNDFAAAGKIVPIQPEKQNGSVKNGQEFYIWEKPDKANSLRQDYRGYKWTEGLALPEVCHVWRRGDNINNNIVAGGLNCPSDKEMVIDGLENHSTVTITYDAENAADKELLYVLGIESKTQAQVNYASAVPGETTISSGDVIEVPYTEDGYIAVKVKKGMIISEIKITYHPSTGIENAGAEAEKADGAWYNMQGVRVAQPAKGVYIHNGKKVVVK